MNKMMKIGVVACLVFALTWLAACGMTEDYLNTLEESYSENESKNESEESSVETEETTSDELSTGLLLDYESIYNVYSPKMKDKYETIVKELQSEVDEGKGVEELADSCAEKIDALAEIMAEGLDKMTDLYPLNHTEYQKWSTKLNSEYLSYCADLNTVYSKGATTDIATDISENIKSQSDSALSAEERDKLASDILENNSEYQDILDKANKEAQEAFEQSNQELEDALEQYKSLLP